MMDIDKTENKALKVGIFISFLMAIAGWVTYYFSGSDAMLLDGNFSFISVFAVVIAIMIANKYISLENLAKIESFIT